MKKTSLLPDFKNPPLTQMELCTIFEPNPCFKMADAGRISELLKEEYPVLTEHFPVEGSSNFSADGLRVNLTSNPELKFISVNKDLIINLKNNAFGIVWNKVDDKSIYPHYDNMYEYLERNFRLIYDFFWENYKHKIDVTDLKIAYSNIIRVESFQEFYDWFDLKLNEKMGFDRLKLNFVKYVESSEGVKFADLESEIYSGVSLQDEHKAFLFNTKLVGKIKDSNFESMAGLFAFGRDEIGKNFKNITTKAAHKKWS